MKKSVILLLVSLFCSFFIAIGAYNLYRGFQSGCWPTVKGVVLNNEVSGHRSSGNKGSKTTYQASVDYKYEVGGKKYFNNTISYKGADASYLGAMREQQKYPVNSEVAVYYNPKNTQQSVLDPGMGKMNLFLIVLPLVVWSMFFFGIRRGQIIVGGKTVFLE
ncbi:MAG: DUF3592 domain-containing protein [Ignavibacteria bacterium]|nr:DUF3592 domain-containing protein [Ignavibacteria bacterium]